MKIATSTIKGVELVKVGQWNSAAGKATVTREHLSGAVDAYADEDIDRPVLKVGHTGGLTLGDSQPAAGWVTNPRLSADGNTLIGDLTDIPAKLAAIVPTAFKRRSVEMSLGVTTPKGKKYAAALTGLALLGAQAPAVKSLADILDIYYSENPGTDDDATRESVVSLSVDDSDTPAVPPEKTSAKQSEHEEPNRAGKNDKEGAEMPPLTDKQLANLRKSLGLPDDATEEDALAALEAQETTDDGTNGKDGKEAEPKPDDKNGEPKPAEKSTEPAPNGEKIAASGTDGVVSVSQLTFSGMQTRLSELEKGAATRRKDDVVTLAMSEGRIAPAEEKAWRERLDQDEKLTSSIMLSLAPRFATFELGDDRAANANDDEELAKQAEAAGI